MVKGYAKFVASSENGDHREEKPDRSLSEEIQRAAFGDQTEAASGPLGRTRPPMEANRCVSNDSPEAYEG